MATDWEKRVEEMLPCIHEVRICRENIRAPVLALLREFAEEAAGIAERNCPPGFYCPAALEIRAMLPLKKKEGQNG